MKYCVKKVYCPNCQRLVKCIEESREGHLHAVCCRCMSSICIRDGVRWRVITTGPTSENIAPVKVQKVKKEKKQKTGKT